MADVEALPFARGRVREVGGTENFPHLGLPDEGQAWAEVERIHQGFLIADGRLPRPRLRSIANRKSQIIKS